MFEANPARSRNGVYFDPREDWLACHVEETIDPDRPIIDTHHHLWERDGLRYLAADMAADIDASGHNVVASVYVECKSMYRTDGPALFHPVGEVEFATRSGSGELAASGRRKQICAAIVGHADLTAGAAVRAVLEGQIEAGSGRFRGVRYQTAWDFDPEVAGMYATRPKGILADLSFREGFKALEPLGLSFDAWLFHTQLDELVDLAKSFSSTCIVLNHCGGPLGVGRFEATPKEAFDNWRAGIRRLAECDNVVVKLGGLGMRLLGHGFHLRHKPPSSDEVAAAWRPYVETCIEAFGPDRAMFESNFPPDKGQASYQVVFNAFKRIASACSEQEKNALFLHTASRVYRIDVISHR